MSKLISSKNFGASYESIKYSEESVYVISVQLNKVSQTEHVQIKKQNIISNPEDLLVPASSY